MISVGIDVSKEKSTICMLSNYGEIIMSPINVNHTVDELKNLAKIIKEHRDIRVVMEATGHYHLPILEFLVSREIFVTVVNPLTIKKFTDLSIRKGKTDKKDSLKIASYGLHNWHELIKFENNGLIYKELKHLSRQYYNYKQLLVQSKVNLANLLDKVMPKIKTKLQDDKLYDFVNKYVHYDNIARKSEKQFINSYISWAKKKGYHQSKTKAKTIYDLAINSITTLDSNYESTKLIVKESIKTITMIDSSCDLILTQMHELARGLPEYEVVNNMAGVGEKLSVRLISEIGDVRKLHSKKALIALAGIDAPAYQSGTFVGTNRYISKRGNKYIRKTGYEVMQCLKKVKPLDDKVYEYIIKKELEGFPKKKAKIAALNKFLRIYYARVMEAYR